MTTRPRHTGLTLIEMLLAVTIAAILAALVITVVVRIDSRSKENLAEGLMGTINAALSEFRDYKFAYRLENLTGSDPCELAFYRSLKFPPDCNDYKYNDIEDEIEKLLGLTSGDVKISSTSDPCDSGCEVMYFFLQMIPASRTVLNEIDKSMLSDIGTDGQQMTITIKNLDRRKNVWTRIIDPWGTTLNYDYYSEDEVINKNFDNALETIRSFPLITSAGPDKAFGTDDDIYNREKTKSTKKLP